MGREILHLWGRFHILLIFVHDQATAFRRRGEAAFSSERYSESVRAFTVAIDIVKKLWQEENVAGVVRSSKLGRALARLLFRRFVETMLL